MNVAAVQIITLRAGGPTGADGRWECVSGIRRRERFFAKIKEYFMKMSLELDLIK